MIRFRDWILKEFDMIAGSQPSQQMQPSTQDVKTTNQLVTKASLSPQFQDLSTSFAGNNKQAAQKQAVNLAQSTIKNQAPANNSSNPLSITSADVANGLLKNIGVPPIKVA